MSLLCDAFINTDSVCVNTGEVKVSKKTLVTSFVKTCSVLAFTYKKINFLAHIDALTPDMESKINMKLKELNPKFINEINIWKGSACNISCPSYEIAKKIGNSLNGKIKYYRANDNLIKIG